MSNYKIPAGGEWKNRYSYASKIYGIHHKTVGEWMKKYGNFDKKLREMGGKSPRQEVKKLKVSQGENEVLKAVTSIIEEEYGEEVLKKHLPESLNKTIPRRKKK